MEMLRALLRDRRRQRDEIADARRRVRDAWNTLGLRHGCRMADIHEALEEIRGRDVLFQAQDPAFFARLAECHPHLVLGHAGVPSGVWVDGGDADHVYYRQSGPLGETAVMLHEAGHMLLGHEPQLLVDGKAVMRRTAYDDTIERDAELFATYALGRSAGAVLSTRAVREADPELLRRITSTLEG